MDFKEFSVPVVCGPKNNPFGLGLDSEDCLFFLSFFLYNPVWFSSTLSICVTSVPMNKYFSLMTTCTVCLVNS